MTDAEKADRQQAFLDALKRLRHRKKALEATGEVWGRVRAWRRWGDDFRRRYDETMSHVRRQQRMIRHARRTTNKDDNREGVAALQAGCPI